MDNPARRFLPPSFPLPEPETLEALRRSIMQETKTKHPPQAAELAAAIVADEAGVDLSALDAHDLWQLSPDEREPLFEALAHLLAELA